MFYAQLQRRKAKVVGAGFNQGVDPFFQETKKRKLITSTGTISNIH